MVLHVPVGVQMLAVRSAKAHPGGSVNKPVVDSPPTASILSSENY